jgi:aminopeptidase YwaD
MIIQFDGHRAYEHIQRLAVDIGPRVMGSSAERQATDYIQRYFEELGLKVDEQAFDVETAVLIDHKFEVVEPALGEIPSWPMMLTPGTPKDGVRGELVLVEGVSAPQVRPHIAGKIVLWSVGAESWLEGKDLLRHRPLALVVIGSAVGVKPKHLQLPSALLEPYDAVPTFFITYEDGLRLVRSGAKEARLHLDTERGTGTSRNIIAELKGDDFPEEIIVVGGHHDTVPEIPGATDNASGTALVMELARLHATRGSKRTLRFVTWGGEEGGLIGSRHYVHELKKQDKNDRGVEGFDERRDKTELEQHLLSISVDVVGMPLGHSACFAVGPIELRATLSVMAKELGVPQEVTEEFYGSDHLPFATVGVPSVAFSRRGAATTYMHGIEDGIELIDAHQLGEVGGFVDTFLARNVAGAQAWPFERKVPEAAQKEIAERLKKWGATPEELGEEK